MRLLLTAKAKTKSREGKGMARKREAAQRMKWLLNLIEIDVVGLSHGDFMKYFYELLTYFYDSPWLDESTLRGFCKDNKNNRGAIREAQEKIRGLLMLLWGDTHESRRVGTAIKCPLEYKPTYRALVENGNVEFISVPEVYIEAEDTLGRRIQSWDGLRQFEPEGKSAGITCRIAGEEGLHVKPFPVDISKAIVYNDFLDPDMHTTILSFIHPLIQQLGQDRIFVCNNPKCSRIEFTNKKKESSYCRSCLTKARVERWRKKVT
jgi:hypothetical protein